MQLEEQRMILRSCDPFNGSRIVDLGRPRKATPVCDLGDVSFKCPLYQAWATGDGNQGSIPTREPKKAAGVQITRSWHGEVATRNIDGARRAMRRLWRRPACMCAVCADHRDKVAGGLTSEKEMMTILLM